MGFTIDQMNMISGKFECIGFREVEVCLNYDPSIKYLSLTFSPITKNSVWISQIWNNYPEYRFLWFNNNQALNLKFNEYDDMIISVIDGETPAMMKLIEQFDQIEDDDEKEDEILREIMVIYDSLLVNNWLQKLCMTNPGKLSVLKDNKTEIFTFGPFDEVFKYESSTDDLYMKDGLVRFYGLQRIKNTRPSFPLLINPKVAKMIAIVDYNKQSSLVYFSDQHETTEDFYTGKDSGLSGVFVIHTTIEEGNHEIVFRLSTDEWIIRLEGSMLMCARIHDCVSSIIMIPMSKVAHIALESDSIHR